MTGSTLKASNSMLQKNHCRISTKEENSRNCHLFKNEGSVHT